MKFNKIKLCVLPVYGVTNLKHWEIKFEGNQSLLTISFQKEFELNIDTKSWVCFNCVFLSDFVHEAEIFYIGPIHFTFELTDRLSKREFEPKYPSKAHLNIFIAKELRVITD
eukprot:552580_1